MRYLMIQPPGNDLGLQGCGCVLLWLLLGWHAKVSNRTSAGAFTNAVATAFLQLHFCTLSAVQPHPLIVVQAGLLNSQQLFADSLVQRRRKCPQLAAKLAQAQAGGLVLPADSSLHSIQGRCQPGHHRIQSAAKL